LEEKKNPLRGPQFFAPVAYAKRYENQYKINSIQKINVRSMK